MVWSAGYVEINACDNSRMCICQIQVNSKGSFCIASLLLPRDMVGRLRMAGDDEQCSGGVVGVEHVTISEARAGVVACTCQPNRPSRAGARDRVKVNWGGAGGDGYDENDWWTRSGRKSAGIWIRIRTCEMRNPRCAGRPGTVQQSRAQTLLYALHLMMHLQMGCVLSVQMYRHLMSRGTL